MIVPFPFTDSGRAKRRPALVLSSDRDFNSEAGHSVMAMITSARHSRWPLDVRIRGLKSAGLPAPSVVRMKLFTLDHRFVIRRAGTLAEEDRNAVAGAVRRLLPIVGPSAEARGGTRPASGSGGGTRARGAGPRSRA